MGLEKVWGEKMTSNSIVMKIFVEIERRTSAWEDEV